MSAIPSVTVSAVASSSSSSSPLSTNLSTLELMSRTLSHIEANDQARRFKCAIWLNPQVDFSNYLEECNCPKEYRARIIKKFIESLGGDSDKKLLFIAYSEFPMRYIYYPETLNEAAFLSRFKYDTFFFLSMDEIQKELDSHHITLEGIGQNENKQKFVLVQVNDLYHIAKEALEYVSRIQSKLNPSTPVTQFVATCPKAIPLDDDNKKPLYLDDDGNLLLRQLIEKCYEGTKLSKEPITAPVKLTSQFTLPKGLLQ